MLSANRFCPETDQCLPIHFVAKDKVHSLSYDVRRDMGVESALRNMGNLPPTVDENENIHYCALIDNLSRQTTSDAQFLKDTRTLAKELYALSPHTSVATIQQSRQQKFNFLFLNYNSVKYQLQGMSSILGETYSTPNGFQTIATCSFLFPTLMILYQLILTLMPLVLWLCWPQINPTFFGTFKNKCTPHIFHPLVKWFYDGSAGRSEIMKWCGFFYMIFSTCYNVSCYGSCANGISTQCTLHSDIRSALINYRYFLLTTSINLRQVVQLCKEMNLKSHEGFVNNTTQLLTSLDSLYMELDDTLSNQGLLNHGCEMSLLLRLQTDETIVKLFRSVIIVDTYVDYLLNVYTTSGFGAQLTLEPSIQEEEEKSSTTVPTFTGINHPNVEESVGVDVPLCNMIISGPNGSGKTTVLRTTMINAIITQILGTGFYENYSITEDRLFESFGSYMHMVDVCGELSLFQAETDRCRKILDVIEASPTARHLCVFDELFSGTNPTDASETTVQFLQTISEKFPNTIFLTTTHHLNICDYFHERPELRVENYYMSYDHEQKQNLFALEKGISRISNVKHIVKDMFKET